MRVCIVDDEEPSRRQLRQLLTSCSDITVCGEASGFSELERIWKFSPSPDIVFLDIELPELDGVQVAERLPKSAMVVFVTAHPEHAAKAFELGAADYLIKPVTAERLKRTFERCRSLRPLKQIWVSRSRRVFMDEIVAIVSGGTYSTLLLASGEHIDEWKSLREWEEELKDNGLIRISRSALVNSRRIIAIDSGPAGYVVRLDCLARGLPVSRRCWKNVRMCFSGPP